MRRVGSTSNEAMNTEDFLRGLFQNGDSGGGMDFRGAVGMPAAERAAQGRSTGWNEADHPRDDIGQFTFKEGGGTGRSGVEKTLLGSGEEAGGVQQNGVASGSAYEPVVWEYQGLKVTQGDKGPRFGSTTTPAEEARYQRVATELLRLSPQEIADRLRGQHPEERFNIMALMVKREGGDWHNSPDARKLALVLEGIAPERVERALALDPQFAHSSAQEAERMQLTFMDELQLEDLPSSMRAETKARIDGMVRAVDNNEGTVKDLFKQWQATEDPRERAALCEKFLGIFPRQASGMPEVRVDIGSRGGGAVASVNPGNLFAPGVKYMYVDAESHIFKDKSPAGFLLGMTGVSHELTHVAQATPIAAVIGGPQRVPASPQIMSMGASIQGSVDRRFSYMVQPHEMQAIIVQMSLFRGMERALFREDQ